MLASMEDQLPPKKPHMKVISHLTYADCDVPLDGNSYEHCTFDSCRFVYAGREPFSLASNNISPDCGFVFTGFAANTVSTMRAIYGMGAWGRQHVLATFQQIAPDLKKLN